MAKTGRCLSLIFLDHITCVFFRRNQDDSNDPAVEPPLADSKPEEATEAVEVPWIFGGPMRKATDIDKRYIWIVSRERERELFVFLMFLTTRSW